MCPGTWHGVFFFSFLFWLYVRDVEPRLDGDVVVAAADPVVLDENVAARVRVDAIGVGRVERGRDGDVVDVDPRRVHRV